LRDDFKWSALVPEFTCRDLAVSLEFHTHLVGAEVAYSRPGFAYLELGAAQWMLEQGPSDWETGLPDLPMGRGINFQIEIADVDALAERMTKANVSLFRPVAENWYRADTIERGQRELLVQDPDGYLLRFATPLGERKLIGAA
jgi:hypothetical protein